MCRTSQFQTPTSHETYRNKNSPIRISGARPRTLPASASVIRPPPAGRAIGVKNWIATDTTAIPAIVYPIFVEFPRNRFAVRNGVISPPSPKNTFARFSAMARCASPVSLASAFAPVTMVPPPTPIRNISSTTSPNPRDRGNSISAARINSVPSTSAIFFPCKSISGPAPSDASISPMGQVKALGKIRQRSA